MCQTVFDKKDVLSLILSIVIGGIISFLISQYFYHKSLSLLELDYNIKQSEQMDTESMSTHDLNTIMFHYEGCSPDYDNLTQTTVTFHNIGNTIIFGSLHKNNNFSDYFPLEIKVENSELLYIGAKPDNTIVRIVSQHNNVYRIDFEFLDIDEKFDIKIINIRQNPLPTVEVSGELIGGECHIYNSKITNFLFSSLITYMFFVLSGYLNSFLGSLKNIIWRLLSSTLIDVCSLKYFFPANRLSDMKCFLFVFCTVIGCVISYVIRKKRVKA